MKTFSFSFLLALGVHAGLAADTIRPVSTRAPGAPAPTTGNHLSGAGFWSPDGQSVVFQSRARDLVQAPTTRGELDVFIRRLGSSSNQLVSVAMDGSGGGNGASSFAQFADSPDRIVFASHASNLVAGDTNGVTDVFLRDMATGVTRLLSKAPDGSPGNGASFAPMVTAGRWVLFESVATNLSPEATNGYPQVYLHDLSTGQTELAALGQDNAVGNLGTWEGRISDDGRWISFLSPSTSLVAHHQVRGPDVYVRDRSNGAVRQLGLGPFASHSVSGVPRVRSYDISPDGRHLALVLGGASYRVGDTTHFTPFALWYDLASDTVRAVTPPGLVAATDSIRLADGGRRVFLDARPAGESTSRVMGWDEANGLQSLEQLMLTLPPVAVSCTNSELVDVTLDGSKLVIASPEGLGGVPVEGLSGEPLLYEWSVITGRTRVLTTGKGGAPMPLMGLPGAMLSPDGAHVVFDSQAPLVEGDINRSLDVFVGPEGEGPAALVSLRESGVAASMATGHSTLGERSLCDDGRWVLFTSMARDLVNPPVDGPPLVHLFLRDMEQGVNRWLTPPAPGQVPTNGLIERPTLSQDGRRVFFSSTRNDLVAGDTNGVSDVFLYEVESGLLRALSVRHGGGATAGGATILAGVDGLGRRVLLESQAGDLIAGGTSGRNLFLHDVETSTTTLISTNSTTPQGSIFLQGAASLGTLSENGEWTAFLHSTASSPVAGELVVRHEDGRVFRVDPGSRTVRMMALAPDGSHVAYIQPALGPSALRILRLPGLELDREITLTASALRSFAFTPDSRRLLLTTTEPLVAEDTNPVADVYMVSVADGVVDWVSSGIARGAAEGASDQPSISRDGRIVAFRTRAPNVALGDPVVGSQVVIRDYSAGLTWRISTPTFPDRREASAGVVVSGDGRSAVFQSLGAGLVAGDSNQARDVFHAGLVPPVSIDSDGDGLPDDWELWNLGTLDQNGPQDSDGDGVSNTREYRAGTHPGDAASRLEMLVPVVKNNQAHLRWYAVPGVAYLLERASDPAGPWTIIRRVDPSSGGLADAVDSSSAGAIYRVRATDRPYR
jgi:Tol biopolymer transport system component